MGRAVSSMARMRQLTPAMPPVCTENLNPNVLMMKSAQDSVRTYDAGSLYRPRHNDLVAELGDAYFDFWESPTSNRPPGGESFVDQISRATEGLAALPAGDIILVVHSGTIRAALAIALDLDPDGALRFVIDPLSLTRIDRLDNGWRVVAVNQR